ncbi:MAG: indolepyruvate oxidoreductase subunit beta [Defluviitaleaceae bacterium]|nr:indolepyruvate oxidoreductase subunit beta [Defluviitaleaceae bacterium]
MIKNILLVGVGGQGTLLASKVLTHGLMQAGYDVKMSEIKGMSQRGGDVSAHIRFGDIVHSSVIEKGSGDLLISFEQMEAFRHIPYMKKNGVVILNNQVIHPVAVLAGKEKYSENLITEISNTLETKIIDATEEAKKLNNPKGANILLIGATIKILGLTDINWENSIKANVKPKFVEPNIRVFNRGMNLV